MAPLEEAYVKHRPLLLSALSKLASNGFPVSVGDGMDLIHEFFVTSWDSVSSRYDPDRAKFETYLFMCFVRFARPRIVRGRRLESALVDPSYLQDLVGDSEVDPREAVAELDLEVIRKSMSNLPDPEKLLLLAFLSEEYSSEQALAASFNITRYRLRETLADSLAKIIVSLGEKAAIQAPEWEIITSLWRDNRTVKETARFLGKPASEIRMLRGKIFKLLSEAVRGKRIERGLIMEELLIGRKEVAVEAGATPREILTNVIMSPGDEEKLRTLKENLEFVIQFLEQEGFDQHLEQVSKNIDSQWLSTVYSTLANDEFVSRHDETMLDFLFEASEEEDVGVSRAFSEVLLPNLPIHLKDFECNVFRDVPRVTDDYFDWLLCTPAVQNGGSAAIELARFGLTPITLLDASHAISNLALRYYDAHSIDVCEAIILDRVGTSDNYSSSNVIERMVSIREIQLTTKLDAERASCVFDWLSGASEYVLYLFDRFECGLCGDELQLYRTDVSIDNLFNRWASQEQTEWVAASY